jgi:hypothetical protein
MQNSLFQPRINRPMNRARRRLVPPLRTNPLIEHTVPLYEISGTGFKSTPINANWKTVYGQVLSFLQQMKDTKGAGKTVKNFVKNNTTFPTSNTSQSATFLAASYLIASWLGFVTKQDAGETSDTSNRLFENTDQYYTHAIALLIGLSYETETSFNSIITKILAAGADPTDDWQQDNRGEDFTNYVVEQWKELWDLAETILGNKDYYEGRSKSYIETILATPMQFPSIAERAKNKEFLSKNNDWLSPNYTSIGAGQQSQRQGTSQSAESAAKSRLKVQIQVLRQLADARIIRFIATYGSNKERLKKMAPYAFNIFYNGRTPNIPTVESWTIPVSDIDNLTGSELAGRDKEPITVYLAKAKRNAIIVYARSNGNAQVFVTTASPASNLGRKHSSAEGSYYVPIIEMTSFPQAEALIAAGLVENGKYKFKNKDTQFDELEVDCCAPHTGFGSALVFARNWRESNLRYRKMDILVFQEKNGDPIWMGYDAGAVGTSYGYDASQVWQSYLDTFDVEDSSGQQADYGSRQTNEFWSNDDADTGAFDFGGGGGGGSTTKSSSSDQQSSASTDSTTDTSSQPKGDGAFKQATADEFAAFFDED